MSDALEVKLLDLADRVRRLPPPLARGTVPPSHPAVAASAAHGGIAGNAARFGSDMHRIRARILATHRINVKVDNHTGAQTFVSANAAAL